MRASKPICAPAARVPVQVGERGHDSVTGASRASLIRISCTMSKLRWVAVIWLLAGCATVGPKAGHDGVASKAAVALGRLLAPLASPETSNDLVGSLAWPGAAVREDGGVIQVELGPRAEARCGFRGRFTVTQQTDQSWLVSVDELQDGRLRYWGTAEVQPDGHGVTLRLDLVVLDGTRGAELVVAGRIVRVAGQWRLHAEGTWNDGIRKVPVRVMRALVANPQLLSARGRPG